MKDKLSVVANLFPEIMMANQTDFFAMALDAYDDKNASKYLRNYQMQLQAQQEAMKRETGGGGGQPTQEKKPEQKKPVTQKENA